MKFWKMTLFCSFGISSLFLALAFHILEISKEDEENYRNLMAVSHSPTALKSDSNYTAKQLKEGTKKTLLMNQGEERKIGKLSCASSMLYLSKENQKTELMEEMFAVDLLYQEELFKEDQILVHLNADHAFYFYNQEKLEAENVRISRYKLPSHEFPKELSSPFFTGRAETLSISFKDKKPTMKAKNLKGISQ